MNPGYLTFILVSVIVILLACGWKEFLLPGVSNKRLALFFAVWLGGNGIVLSLGSVHLTLSYAVVAGLSLVLLKTAGDVKQSLGLVMVSLLIAACDYLFLEIYSVNPFMTVIDKRADIALILGSVGVLLNRHPYRQMMILSLALLLGEAWYQVSHFATKPIKLGTADFMDQWWLTIFATRVATATVQEGYRRSKRMMRNLANRREREWKE
ncbi:MAG: hypothetical protein K0R75_1777 [Paenibacillaceae bacterium]|jgi:hypothetical protein|nr:hypothetical protein [Paenibacillaceae bacterium]